MYCALILSNDKPNKMQSEIPVALHEICFKSILQWVLDAADGAAEKTIISHYVEIKDAICEKANFIYKEKNENIFYAALRVKERLCKYDSVLVMTDAMPLITGDTVSAAYCAHVSGGRDVTVITGVKGADAQIGGVEDKSRRGEAGFIKTKALIAALESGAKGKRQEVYCFSDIIAELVKMGALAGEYNTTEINELISINDREQLWAANEIMQRRIIKRHMQKGVTFVSPNTAYISGGAVIGRDTIVLPNTIIQGNTEIGQNCTIGPNSKLADAKIGNAAEVNNSVIVSSKVGSGVRVGPFAYIRPGCDIGNNVKIGDFVEVKNSVIKDGTSASHLTYIGDADVGSNVNFGCGTIVVNYDGKKKHRTVIGDHAFIGCNTNLVSPLNVGRDTFIAAGSTITKDIPDCAFAIARSKQTIKTDWKRK